MNLKGSSKDKENNNSLLQGQGASINRYNSSPSNGNMLNVSNGGVKRK